MKNSKRFKAAKIIFDLMIIVTKLINLTYC